MRCIEDEAGENYTHLLKVEPGHSNWPEALVLCSLVSL